jgi:hypothetical protein
VHDVRIRNRDGQGDYASYGDSLDDIFNKKAEVEAGVAMFYQDDYFGGSNPDLGLGEESSRSNFVIYETEKFKEAFNEDEAWTGYLESLVPDTVYINPYTGRIISSD